MAGVIIFIKLSNGLSDYPYLFQSQVQELQREYNIKDPSLEVLAQLMRDRQVYVSKDGKDRVN